ncbi:MAG: Ornithine decarboxylase [Ramalina farinacea]|uniref:ornithine decarboxylase n=1 Tax=Ramalina farinacea TaxID=258253 RepID=A0AA43QVT6_9LECA|nr:Ornithine decarboxylase [Ramalina farinacea]
MKSPTTPPQLTGSSNDNARVKYDTQEGTSSERRLTQDRILDEIRRANDEEAFFIVDLGQVKRLCRMWEQNLPGILPHYAVKCNPNSRLIETLASVGINYDCASESEMNLVLSLGVDPRRIILANPIKPGSMLRYAKTHGVRRMTFDNADELHKVAGVYHDAELYLRITACDPRSATDLSSKFGCSKASVAPLLALARQLDLSVTGIAFHVGTGAKDANAYVQAIQDSKEVIEEASRLGFQIRSLDIGGGFVQERLPALAPEIRRALEHNDYFSSRGIQVLAEPGAFFAASIATLACNVIGRRTGENDQGAIDKLYLNDGVYGSFLNVLLEGPELKTYLLKSSSFERRSRQGKHAYSLWGPTLDSTDKLCDSYEFDDEVEIGDWLYFEDMGAYTSCTATSFNGFPPVAKTLYIDSDHEP